MPVQLDRGVGRLHAEHDRRVRSDQWRGVVEAEHLGRVLDQLLEPGRGRVLLLAVLVVGHRGTRTGRFRRPRWSARCSSPRSGQTPEVIATDPGVMWIFSGSRFHSPVGPRDREQLLGVRPRALPELARQAGQAALVLHVVQELRRPVRVGGDDHLLGGVRVTVTMRRSLRPARVTRVHLEPASVERDEVVHLVQLVDLDAELLREVEVVRRQLVLGVVAAADVAVAARDAAGAARSDAAEVRIVGLDARGCRSRRPPGPC